MWPVMVFFTNSTVHMLAHGSWAQVMMLAGASELGLVRGKLHSRYWHLTMPLAFVVSGTAFLIHEQNSWFFARSAFLHHVIGWTMLTGAIFPLLHLHDSRSGKSSRFPRERKFAPTGVATREDPLALPSKGMQHNRTAIAELSKPWAGFRPTPGERPCVSLSHSKASWCPHPGRRR